MEIQFRVRLNFRAVPSRIHYCTATFNRSQAPPRSEPTCYRFQESAWIPGGSPGFEIPTGVDHFNSPKGGILGGGFLHTFNLHGLKPVRSEK